jgi:membrane-associated phospholipid phosphatase
LKVRSAVLELLAPAIVLFAGFWWLGLHVIRHGEPPALWVFAQHVRGHALGLASALTEVGRAPVLAPLYMCVLAVAIFVRQWRLRASYLLICALAAWGCADALQRLFARPRRLDWLVHHEQAFSYPSSHAAISTAFFLLAGVLLLRSELRTWLRYLSFGVLTLLWLGICWSRLSLAAHYPTDIIGGCCLGSVLVLVGAAVIRVTGEEVAVR